MERSRDYCVDFNPASAIKEDHYERESKWFPTGIKANKLAFNWSIFRKLKSDYTNLSLTLLVSQM